LAELPDLLSRLADLRHGVDMPTGDVSVAARLTRIEERARRHAAASGDAALRCPRCGSTDVDMTYSDGASRRYYQIHCNSCGKAEDWFEGNDQVEKRWRPRQTSAAAAPEAAATGAAAGGAWVDIPGGRFHLGLTTERAQQLAFVSAHAARRRLTEQRDLDPDEVDRFSGNVDYLATLLRAALPARPIELGPYRIAAAPVSNGDYRAFMAATGAEVPARWTIPGADEASRPVLGVSRSEAAAYAAWAGAALPSAGEWQRAARGADAQLFPWGDDWGDAGAWIDAQEVDVPWPAHERADLASPDGCLAMVTGRWEWCDGELDADGAALAALTELYAGTRARGGARCGGPGVHLVAGGFAATGIDPAWRPIDTGFRLVRR
ncbi:MAG TPA: SUMF1/EgtB/PvdO family nonheme iron enzyme, partial [Kofleriaceae bacterium]|nr:SUMF1/EgtB/PvdO family nonheme iron enzyme [Kofleriaceae bacterium]